MRELRLRQSRTHYHRSCRCFPLHSLSLIAPHPRGNEPWRRLVNIMASSRACVACSPSTMTRIFLTSVMPEPWDVGQMLTPTMIYRRPPLSSHRTTHQHIPAPVRVLGSPTAAHTDRSKNMLVCRVIGRKKVGDDGRP